MTTKKSKDFPCIVCSSKLQERYVVYRAPNEDFFTPAMCCTECGHQHMNTEQMGILMDRVNQIKEFSVLQVLPLNGDTVWAYGHKTYCCSEDMDEEPDWHRCVFTLKVTAYKKKEQIPEDPEESILEYCEAREFWLMPPNNEQPWSVIGVTKWKEDGDSETE